MRRYLFNGSLEGVPVEHFDVVIVGHGIAGLYTALRLDPSLSCAVLTKSDPQLSSSWLAQGGIAAVMIEEDTRAAHIQDTLVAGAGLCDEQAVRTLIAEGPRDVQNLIDWGVPFDLDDAGKIVLTREGGHSASRILHCGGDATGRGVTQRLAELAAGRPNLWMRDHVYLIDVLVDDGETTGVLAWDNGYRIYRAPNVVLCTGGIGQNYEYTTNPSTSTGDGIAAAIRAGARVKDMEFVQFHPTALMSRDPSRRFFLISEAVRGEGAVLRNVQGDRFMQDIHPMAELAPRDIVTRGIMREMEKTQSTYVYLDSTHRSAEELSARFPTIYAECLRQGIDISRQWIPIRPVQHYMMGGIRTGLDAMSNVPGLYAVGEAACTGVHGANRLASNSLLECLVFGRRCAQAIGGSGRRASAPALPEAQPPLPAGKADLPELRWLLRHRMMKNGGIVRRTPDMRETLSFIRDMKETLESARMSTLDHIELMDMAAVSEAVLTAALDRGTSVGAHFREKDPDVEPAEAADLRNGMEGLDSMNWMTVDPILLNALLEDLGSGDVTTSGVVMTGRPCRGRFIAKEDGVVCGLNVAQRVFEHVDRLCGESSPITMKVLAAEGAPVRKGDILATIEGPAAPILSGERVALNFLQHLSGIATRTADAVAKVQGCRARIVDTRKTTPGLRILEKYAVRTGGGANHRLNLSDGVLIKDNHIVAAGGITAAVKAVRGYAPHTLKIEVEVENLAQVDEAMAAGADILLLDNMTNDAMRAAVERVAGRALTEASGNMGDKDLREVAATGVDLISIGALTHSVRAMDISLRFD